MLSPTMLKSGVIELNHLKVIDDDGWLFESKKVKNYIKVATPTEYFDLEPDEDGFLWSGIFQMGQLKTTYERKYTRLQTVLAQIQGSAATVILALVILLRPYSQVKFKEVLINELFDVKVRKRDDPNINGKNSGNKKPKKRNSFAKDKQRTMMEQAKQAPTAQEFEMKLTKIPSKEALEGNQFLSLASDRPLNIVKEEKLLERRLSPKNQAALAQSFKTLLHSIENENCSPEIVNNQKSAQTLEKVALLTQGKEQETCSSPDTRRKSKRGQSLAIDKPDKIKLTALSDVISDGPDSPRKISDISLKEEKSQEEQENEKACSVENAQKDYLQLSSPPISPQNVTERQDLISLEMGDLKQNDGQEASEGEEMDDETQDEDALNYESQKIDISIWEFFASYIRKTKKTQEKFELLNKGMKNVKERMDILNIMKKFRELDKLKALLLEEDQLTLFNAMPKARIKSGQSEIATDELMKSKSFSQRILKKSTFIEANENQEHIKQSYDKIQMKAKKSKIDHKLMELYKSMLLNKEN